MEFLELFLRRRFAEGNQWWRRMTGYLSVHCQPVSTLSKLIHFECFAVLRSYPLVKNLTSFQIQRTNVSLLASHWYGRCDVPYIQHVAKTMRKRKILRVWPSSQSSQLRREKRNYETEVSAYGLKTFVAPFLPTQLTAGSRWFLACFRLSYSWALRQQ